MGNLDNYKYTQGEMQTAISDLETSKQNMSNDIDKIKSELRDKLLATGMTGTTADALLATFEKEVVTPAEEYLATADHFINQNKNVEMEMAANSADNVKTAQM